jgi:hypothetical protein
VASPAVPVLVAPAEVIRALLEGEHIVHLRPSGGGGPPVGSGRLWLLPTADPDGAPELKPAYRLARQLSVPDPEAPPGQVRVEGWAELAATGTARLDPEAVAALESKTVLALDRLADQIGGGDVAVLVLRAHRLLEPVIVGPDLAGLPADPASVPSELALSDVAFDARLTGVENALPGGLSRPT